MHASHVAATYRKGKKTAGSPKVQVSDTTARRKRKSGAKSQGSVVWLPLSNPDDDSSNTSCWVLGRRGEETGDIRSHDTAIVSGSLFARAISATNLDIGEHLPRRTDSIFIHPDTMHLCGITIAQPVAIRDVNSRRSTVAICKPWPFRSIDLDAVALSPLVLRSVLMKGQGGGEGRVEVWKVPSPLQLSPASEVHLTPLSIIDHTLLNNSFKNYIRALYDGLYLCKGNTVSVPFCHEDIEFSVTKVLPFSPILEPNMGSCLSFNTSTQNLTTLLEDSLHLNISGLCLGGGAGGSPRLSPNQSSPTPMRTSSFSHLKVITSTPGMDVDHESRSGTESGHAGYLEPNHSQELANSLEDKLEGLGLDDHDGVSEREEHLVEVLVCKITTKTQIVFVETEKTIGQGGVTMADIGGLSIQKTLLKELVLYPLQNSTIDRIQFPHGVLLHGPSGVGKSLLVQALLSETTVHCISLTHPDMTSSEVLAKRLTSLFKEARDKCPCIIVINDLHILCSTGTSVSSSTLAACLDTLHTTPPPKHVVVMATTNQIEDIDSSLRRPGRFDREIEFPTPTALERREILDVLLRGVSHCLKECEVVGVADSAHGYTGSDLRAVCMQAQHKALHRHLEITQQRNGEREEKEEEAESVVVKSEDMWNALREVRPSAMKEVIVEVPKVLWCDIGGQEDVKRRLREAVEWPLCHPEAFTRLGINPPKGVLLYGPPGCSKTMIARALATESSLNFIAVKGPELFSKWVGDSEKAVRQVFRRARAAAPAIIFFDEIDALAVQRNSGSSSVADRVLAQLLTEMDGVERLKDVLIVAATNRPDMIDKALLRPGRIDRMIYVPLPSDATRREIFQINFQTTPVSTDVSLDQLVSLTQGFSGAEVVALCQEAGLCALHEDITTKIISFSHFQQALKIITPQTQPSTIASYERYSKTMH